MKNSSPVLGIQCVPCHPGLESDIMSHTETQTEMLLYVIGLDELEDVVKSEAKTSFMILGRSRF